MTNHLVRYFSPFGGPPWIPGWQAETRLEQEQRRWSRLEELDMVSNAQRALGPPRLERP